MAAGTKQKSASVKQSVSNPGVRSRGPPPKRQLERVGGLVTKKSRKLAEKKDKKKRKKAGVFLVQLVFLSFNVCLEVFLLFCKKNML